MDKNGLKKKRMTKEQRKSRIDELYRDNQIDINPEWNQLLMKYLNRSQVGQIKTVPKHLSECSNCSEVFDSKILASHKKNCEIGDKKRNIFKSHDGTFYCNVCKSSPADSQYHSKFRLHLLSHGPEELQKAKYDTEKLFGKDGYKALQEVKLMNMKLTKAQVVQQIINERFEIIKGNDDAGNELHRLQQIQSQIYKDEEGGNGGKKEELNNSEYKKLLFGTHFSEIQHFETLCKSAGIYCQISQLQQTDEKFCSKSAIIYDISKLFQNQSAWMEFVNTFKIMNLIRELRIKDALALEQYIVTQKTISLKNGYYNTSLKYYLIMQPDSHIARLILLRFVNAVAALHENYIVHKNLAPENILINDIGEVKVAISDFRHSQTLVFTSLERHQSRSVYLNNIEKWPSGSENHDLYSIGVILLENLKGTDSFKTQFKTVKDIRAEICALIERDDIHPGLKNIWKNTILKQDKLHTAKEILVDLSSCFIVN